jgi:hypothetical protein
VELSALIATGDIEQKGGLWAAFFGLSRRANAGRELLLSQCGPASADL